MFKLENLKYYHFFQIVISQYLLGNNKIAFMPLLWKGEISKAQRQLDMCKKEIGSKQREAQQAVLTLGDKNKWQMANWSKYQGKKCVSASGYRR